MLKHSLPLMLDRFSIPQMVFLLNQRKKKAKISGNCGNTG